MTRNNSCWSCGSFRLKMSNFPQIAGLLSVPYEKPKSLLSLKNQVYSEAKLILEEGVIALDLQNWTAKKPDIFSGDKEYQDFLYLLLNSLQEFSVPLLIEAKSFQIIQVGIEAGASIIKLSSPLLLNEKVSLLLKDSTIGLLLTPLLKANFFHSSANDMHLDDAIVVDMCDILSQENRYLQIKGISTERLMIDMSLVFQDIHNMASLLRFMPIFKDLGYLISSNLDNFWDKEDPGYFWGLASLATFRSIHLIHTRHIQNIQHIFKVWRHFLSEKE